MSSVADCALYSAAASHVLHGPTDPSVQCSFITSATSSWYQLQRRRQRATILMVTAAKVTDDDDNDTEYACSHNSPSSAVYTFAFNVRRYTEFFKHVRPAASSSSQHSADHRRRRSNACALLGVVQKRFPTTAHRGACFGNGNRSVYSI